MWQLVGPTVLSTFVNYLMTKWVEITKEEESQWAEAFRKIFNKDKNASEITWNSLDSILGRLDKERWELSTYCQIQYQKDKEELLHEIDKFVDSDDNSEKSKNLLFEKYIRIIANMFSVARPDEITTRVATIHAIWVWMTPVADNIAAVLFMISANNLRLSDVYWPEILKEEIEFTPVPELPFYKIKITVEESLIMTAALLWINLWNWTRYGNAVQLLEQITEIIWEKSDCIGDLEVQKKKFKDYGSRFSIFWKYWKWEEWFNPHSLALDIWTWIDVTFMINEIMIQVKEKGKAFVPKQSSTKKAHTSHH